MSASDIDSNSLLNYSSAYFKSKHLMSVGYLARSVHWNGVEKGVEPDFVITNELVALL